MKPDRFNKLTEEVISTCKQTLCDKSEEYSRNGDRLWNFKVAAVKRDITPESALYGMYAKHDVSVLDLVSDPDSATLAALKEKIGDAINYHLLLYALFVERIESSQINPIIKRTIPTPVDDDYNESSD